MKWFIAYILLLFIAGCSSTPGTDYYLLRSKALETTMSCDCSIGIGPVTVAEYLNRAQITVSNNPGQLSIDQYRRWGEPLRNSIERVLIENLAVLTDTSQLVTHPWRQDQQPHYAVRVNILGMDRAAGAATVKVQWQIVDNNTNKTVATEFENYTRPLATGDYRDLVEGFSEILLQLSERIAGTLAERVNAKVE